MRNKSKSFEKFEEFQNEVQNQLGKIIKFPRSDRVGEYLILKFSHHLKQNGIVSGMPQWNHMSERSNQTLLYMVRSIMSQIDFLMSFWGYV
jgi:hypothetical protein